jgi:excisionase family DNA binding protein
MIHPPARKYYRPAEAALILGVCPSTIYRMIKDGQFGDCCKRGGGVRIPAEAVDCPAPTPPPPKKPNKRRAHAKPYPKVLSVK